MGWDGKEGNPHNVYRIMVDSGRRRNYEDESMPIITSTSYLIARVMFEFVLIIIFRVVCTRLITTASLKSRALQNITSYISQ
jgi:hypothetical protein